MSAPLWSFAEAGAAMGARGADGPAIGGISIDTRTLAPGDLFFALADQRDGHDFVPGAFAKGAAGAVIDQAHADALAGQGPLIVVADVLQALQALGAAGRARADARIIAVTGSVGKTSTKEAPAYVLAGQVATHASAASYNNHWGVPLTLARMPAATRFGVVEIGMNHAGEITPLAALARPHAAIVTAVEAVHIENLGSIEAVADAKAEIFSGIEPGGAAIIPRDSPFYERLKGHLRSDIRALGFGDSPQADIRLLGLKLDASGCDVSADIAGTRVDYRLASPGRHAAMNSLAALGAIQAIGADGTAAAAAMAGVGPPAGRGARLRLAHPNGVITLIDESYNANPASARAALAVLARAPVGPGGRRVAILGDMLELGAMAPALHAGLAEAVIEHGVDIAHLAGPLSRHLHEALPAARRGFWAPSAAELAEFVADAIGAGDAVMVKGSNGSRMGAIVAALKKRYPLAGQDGA